MGGYTAYPQQFPAFAPVPYQPYPQYQPYSQGYQTYPQVPMIPPYGLNSTQGYPTSPQMTPQPAQDVFQSSNPPAQKIKTNPTKLSLFFINDLHGHLDNMTNILGASKQFDLDAQRKGADAIKLSAGDNIAGADVPKDDLMFKFLDYIGIDASAVGNHEYDASASKFYQMRQTKNTKFLAANAMTPNGSEFYNNVQKSTIIEENGNKYGIVGLMPTDLETVASKVEFLEGVRPYSLEESAKAAQIEIDKLRAQGINKIILLSHLGIDKDMQIASMLDGVDIIQGGHSHNLTPELEHGKNVVMSKTGEPVVIVQGGENGKYAGVLDVEFDEYGIIKTASLNINKANLEKSPVLEYIKEATLGPSPKLGFLKKIDPLPENRRTTPCAWTEFMCEAMRHELDTDIAFINAANTRGVPKAGIVTERDITEASPLKNTLVKIRMTEKEVVQTIKMAAKRSLSHPTGEPGIMHTGGINYKATSTGEILEMSFVDKQGRVTPININNPSDKVYTVSTDSFVIDDRGEKTEYPEMLLKNHQYKDVQEFNFDKDKATIEYMKKLNIQDDFSIVDEGKIQILEPDGTPRTVKGQIESASKFNA